MIKYLRCITSRLALALRMQQRKKWRKSLPYKGPVGGGRQDQRERWAPEEGVKPELGKDSTKEAAFATGPARRKGLKDVRSFLITCLKNKVAFFFFF